jgi:hypothetical protein
MAENNDRDKFCWNCLYYSRASHEAPCKDCHGVTPDGKWYCYKNWKEGIDYVHEFRV